MASSENCYPDEKKQILRKLEDRLGTFIYLSYVLYAVPKFAVIYNVGKIPDIMIRWHIMPLYAMFTAQKMQFSDEKF